MLDWIMPIAEQMTFMADTAIQAAATIMGTLVLEEPLFYYRWHEQNRWAIDSGDARSRERLRSRAEMAELVYGGVSKRLIQLGVSYEHVAALLGDVCLEATRSRLQLSGGKRTEAFQTEMQSFHKAFKRPSMGYRLYKSLVVAPATMLLPPRQFYALHHWYAKHELGRYRNRFLKEEAGAPKNS